MRPMRVSVLDICSLPSLDNVLRMLLVVSNDRDADAIGDFPKKEVIWEAPQINPSTVSHFEMKTLRTGGGLLDQ